MRLSGHVGSQKIPLVKVQPEAEEEKRVCWSVGRSVHFTDITLVHAPQLDDVLQPGSGSYLCSLLFMSGLLSWF